mmetsp:Transcript_20684/g.42217  ORF Transcript_20684/g.42217 Transcript_20684/m.42217 type:complete len:113 (-) Transcript_20684:5111-5449(-)
MGGSSSFQLCARLRSTSIAPKRAATESGLELHFVEMAEIGEHNGRAPQKSTKSALRSHSPSARYFATVIISKSSLTWKQLINLTSYRTVFLSSAPPSSSPVPLSALRLLWHF